MQSGRVRASLPAFGTYRTQKPGGAVYVQAVQSHMTQNRTQVRRRITSEAEDYIHKLFREEGLREWQVVSRRLAEALREGDIPMPVPSDRTIKRILDELSEIYTTEPASLAAFEPATARLVLDSLREAVAATEGRIAHVTATEATWIGRVAAAAPSLSPWDRFRVARAYVLRDHTGASTTDLDALVAFQPWLGPQERDAYRGAVVAGWIAPCADFHLLVGLVLDERERFTVDGEPFVPWGLRRYAGRRPRASRKPRGDEETRPVVRARKRGSDPHDAGAEEGVVT